MVSKKPPAGGHNGLTCKCIFSPGICLDMLCRISENWENVTCDLKSGGQSFGKLDAGHMALGFQWL